MGVLLIGKFQVESVSNDWKNPSNVLKRLVEHNAEIIRNSILPSTISFLRSKRNAILNRYAIQKQNVDLRRSADLIFFFSAQFQILAARYCRAQYQNGTPSENGMPKLVFDAHSVQIPYIPISYTFDLSCEIFLTLTNFYNQDK